MSLYLNVLYLLLIFFSFVASLILVGACVVLHRKVGVSSTWLMVFASALLVVMQVAAFGLKFLLIDVESHAQLSFAIYGLQYFLNVCFAICFLMFAMNLPAMRRQSKAVSPERPTGERG